MSHVTDIDRSLGLAGAIGAIRLDSEVAKHEQVRSRLIEVIGTLSSGDRLPPERELATRFGVSRMTLRQAISRLAGAGYVVRVQGDGTFVAAPTISKNSELTGFSEDMVARGFRPSSRLLKITHVSAGAALGQELVISPAELVYHLERVRMADGIPMCLETVDLPAHLTPGLDKQPLERSLYEILSNSYGIELYEADQVILPTVVDQVQADLLRVPVHSAALVVKRIGYDKKRRPVERAMSIYRGDRYDIRMTVRRSLT